MKLGTLLSKTDAGEVEERELGHCLPHSLLFPFINLVDISKATVCPAEEPWVLDKCWQLTRTLTLSSWNLETTVNIEHQL